MMNIHDFECLKRQGQKISMVTCYDFWSAKILNETDINCLLVGDSLAMVMHGFDSTVHADIDLMRLHVSAVRRGAPDKFVVADMPFLSCSKGLEHAMDGVQSLMQAGGSAVKVEGQDHQVEIIRHIVEAGVPVMGHIGLTPQSVHSLGGHRVQGRDEAHAQKLIRGARELEEAGCFALVLECVPAALARTISENLSIPTIGIGAGADTDGQVLVFQDLLGMDPTFKPRFLRHYACGNKVISGAINQFHQDVQRELFPSAAESYK